MKKKTKTDGKSIRQIMFFEQYYENNFNIKKTCDALGMTRQTFYLWLRIDKEFAEQFIESNNFITNLIVSGFIEGITDDNLAIRIKYLAAIPPRILLKAFGEDPNEDVNVNIKDFKYKIK